MKTLIIILSLLSTMANADSDKNKFISGLAQRYIALLCNDDYLSCLNINKTECVSSVMAATSGCPISSFYKAAIEVNKDGKLQFKKIENEGYLFGNCVSDRFFTNMNITEKTVKDCENSLPELEAAK